MVTFRNGLNSQSLRNWNGRLISDVFDDETLCSILNLDGHESITILRNGLNINANSYTELFDGDTVTFSQNVGVKG